MVPHLAEMRTAGDSAQVAQKDHYDGFGGEGGQRNGAAVATEEREIAHCLA